jgi:hypothetical protein
VGRVIECCVVRDKGTSESKGSAFIWYVNKAQADAAVAHFNNRHTLPDPTGEMVGSALCCWWCWWSGGRCSREHIDAAAAYT